MDEATIPGGILFGFEAGLMIGGFWGLKDLLLEAAKHLHTFINYSIDAAELAWYAGDGTSSVSEDADISAAAKLFAFAIAELWWVILQALIAWVLKKAAGLAGQAAGAAIEGTALETALAEASEKSAAFGKPFTNWFKTNFKKIRAAVESRTRKLKAIEEGDAATNLDVVASARRAQSYKDIDAYQKRYEAARDQAIKSGDSPARVGAFKAKVTEAVGEREATKYIEQNDPNLQMEQGFAPGTSADQVYATYDANGNTTGFVVVEAKGPGATLSQSAAKGPQMSQQWMNNTIKEMAKSSDPETRALGQRLQDAMDDGEPPITGKVIQALPGGGAQELPCPVSVYNPPQ